MEHLGEKIKKVLEQRGMSITQFSKRIGTSRENVYAIFKRRGADTEILEKISQALDHNFFQYFVKKEDLYPDLGELSRQLAAAEKEIAYLKKINELLENNEAEAKKPSGTRKKP